MRYLKALGLAMLAAFAVSAFATASASAEATGEITSTDGTETFFGHGVDHAETDYFEAFGRKVECHETTFEIETFTAESTAPVHDGDIAVTVTPTYEECANKTVTMNGCDYDFYFDEAGSVDLTCPPEQRVEIHEYSSPAHEPPSICTTTVDPNHSLEGMTYKNLENGNITAEGTIGGITATSHGSCSFGFTLTDNNASYVASVEIDVKDAEGNDVPAHIG